MTKCGRTFDPRDEAGVTLLEQLLVLLIIGVMMAMVVPSVTRLYEHKELDVAARTVVSDVRDGQTTALAHQDIYELWFSKFKPSYTLWENGAYLGQTVLPQRVGYLNGYLDQTVSDLRFDQNGVTTGNGNVRLVNQDGEESDIAIYITTGIVIYDGVHKR